MPRAKRRLSQHFLTDPRLLARIADALAPSRDDTVLEVGPGAGGLTAALLERAGRVVAIEKDQDLVPELRARFPGATIVHGDALESDWRALAGPRFLVAGNIPYNITSPLIDKALEPPRPARIVYLVQLEVAERVTASPGTRGVRRAQRRSAGGRACGTTVHGAGRRVPPAPEGRLRGVASGAAR